jgi:phosphate transport system substrate-binding protein
VQQTPNSIGYVELIYAIQHELTYAAVRNSAGVFVKADLASIKAAASASTAALSSDDFRISILNASARDAYPVSTFTYLLIPTDSGDAQKHAAIAEFLRWVLTAGQKECALLGYPPLPKEMAARELNAVNALK